MQQLINPDGNLDSAREWAQRALRSNPLNARTLALLGLIAERKGDQKGADALMRIAGARTWNDPMTNAWLFNREIARGDYPNALPYLDAMLRIDFEAQKRRLLPMLVAFTNNPLAFKALTTFLATSPPLAHLVPVGIVRPLVQSSSAGRTLYSLKRNGKSTNQKRAAALSRSTHQEREF